MYIYNDSKICSPEAKFQVLLRRGNSETSVDDGKCEINHHTHPTPQKKMIQKLYFFKSISTDFSKQNFNTSGTLRTTAPSVFTMLADVVVIVVLLLRRFGFVAFSTGVQILIPSPMILVDCSFDSFPWFYSMFLIHDCSFGFVVCFTGVQILFPHDSREVLSG